MPRRGPDAEGTLGRSRGTGRLAGAADIPRMARRLIRRAVLAARADDERSSGCCGSTSARRPRACRGPRAVAGLRPREVQAASTPGWRAGAEHELVGPTGFRTRASGWRTCCSPAAEQWPRCAAASRRRRCRAARRADQACVRCGLYLVDDATPRSRPAARTRTSRPGLERSRVEVACADQAAASGWLRRCGSRRSSRNVFRGQVLAFGDEMFGQGAAAALLSFLDRPLGAPGQGGAARPPCSTASSAR